MDPATLAKIENVKKAVARIKNSENASIRICEFCDNVNLIIMDVQHEKFEKVQSWIQIYDVQADMSILMNTVLHPFHLSLEEKQVYKDDIQTIIDFIEFARINSKKSEV